MSTKKNVAIIGSGNWGSAIARIVGDNVKKLPSYHDIVKIWVYEETLKDGRKLSEVINEEHENVKYLPGYKFPSNVVAVTDIVEASKDADILVFVMPHQFLERSLLPLKGKLKPGAFGVSLIKGFHIPPGGGIRLISCLINEILDITVHVLMGANLAPEVAEGKFCETTIGVRDINHMKSMKDLFQTDNFRVVVVDDADAVEVCGALKNIVGVGAGFVDGLGYGDNTKAAVIRLGLMEMIKFTEVFYPGAKLSTFFESCGVADLVTTCYGGRNRRVAEAVVKHGKSIATLEKEMLDGQRLQGPETAAEVNYMLKEKQMEARFPLFTAIHRICEQELPPSEMIDCIKVHPEHLYEPSFLQDLEEGKLEV
ncbi:unnamed protein product [Darwinula stevensoni]|uniref:Glycerol-3-phosphate dehydrogenase [NAD(+)] n=1 Tax=Darwinula stevensoni TaxID=69355 RepID=A0A7R9FND9_9CRUS|nr:unnamed protein product [Darwinula stevensoni]CAG0896590.1 unnamed protein product [Darwinula stevensoni]